MKLTNYFGDDHAIIKALGILTVLILGTLIITLETKTLILLIAGSAFVAFILFSPVAGLCLLAFVGPFAGLMKIVPGVVTGNKLLGGLVAVSLFVHLALNRRNNFPTISIIILLYFLLVFLHLPILLWSSDPLDGLLSIGARFSVIGLAFLVAFIIRNPAQMKIFCGCATSGAALMGLYIIVFGMESLAGEYGKRLAAGTNENVLSHALAVGLLLSVFLLTEVSLARKALVLTLDFFILIAIGLTGSRGTWMALIIPLIIIPLAHSRMRLRTRIVALTFSAATIMAVAFGISKNFFGYWGQLVTERTSILTAESSGISTVSGGRMDYIWPVYLEEITKRPLFGSGFDARDYILRASHNDILNILAELGIIGFIVFAIFVWQLFKQIGRCENNSIRIPSLALLWFLLVAGMTHNTIYLKSFSLAIGMICSLLAIYGKTPEPR
jgi:O-antigen ligase